MLPRIHSLIYGVWYACKIVRFIYVCKCWLFIVRKDFAASIWCGLVWLDSGTLYVEVVRLSHNAFTVAVAASGSYVIKRKILISS